MRIRLLHIVVQRLADGVAFLLLLAAALFAWR
jgi:hypothetical protein